MQEMVDALRGRIHQIKLALVFQNICNARVLPHRCHGRADPGLQRRVWIGIHLVVQQVVHVLVILRVPGINAELAHGTDQGFGAVDHVLVNSQAIQGQLVSGVAILVNDFHLLDNR